jgi:hypothetical protein
MGRKLLPEPIAELAGFQRSPVWLRNDIGVESHAAPLFMYIQDDGFSHRRVGFEHRRNFA